MKSRPLDPFRTSSRLWTSSTRPLASPEPRTFMDGLTEGRERWHHRIHFALLIIRAPWLGRISKQSALAESSSNYTGARTTSFQALLLLIARSDGQWLSYGQEEPPWPSTSAAAQIHGMAKFLLTAHSPQKQIASICTLAYSALSHTASTSPATSRVSRA